jgi:copper resistance protein D
MSMLDGPDALSVAFRAVSFVLLLNAAGIPIFIATFGHLLRDSIPTIRQLGWQLALGALVFVTLHHALEAARMAGDMSGLMDPAMQGMALRSSEGAAFGLRLVGLALIAVGMRRGRSSALAVVGSVASCAAFTLTGHTSVSPYRAGAAALLILHLLIIAFWLGALWPLYLAPRKEPLPVAARLIDAFSGIAVWLIPVVLLAGIALTALLVPDLSVFNQPYGQLLLVKIAAFVALMGLAALNKWRLGPACAAGHTRAFRQTVAIEYVLICIVLAVTATMTTFYSPEGP